MAQPNPVEIDGEEARRVFANGGDPPKLLTIYGHIYRLNGEDREVVADRDRQWLRALVNAPGMTIEAAHAVLSEVERSRRPMSARDMLQHAVLRQGMNP